MGNFNNNLVYAFELELSIPLDKLPLISSTIIPVKTEIQDDNYNTEEVLDNPNELLLLKKAHEQSKETKFDEKIAKVQIIEGDVKSMFGDNSKENKTNKNVRRSSRIGKKIRYYKDESDENDEINNGMGMISTR